MIYVGIDISKYKHDLFICNDFGEIIVDNFSFSNNQKGFQLLLKRLKPLSNVRIGMEATGHYGLNLKMFLEKNNYSFMEFNPLLVKEFHKSLTLRKTKTDKVDAMVIARKLMSIPYKPNSPLSYHKFGLKSLTRYRSSLVKQRSKHIIEITNVLDIIFPEFKSFFNDSFSVTSLFILNKYKSAEKIANIRDFETLRKLSRGKFTYAKFIKLKELAENTIGESNDLLKLQLETSLTLYNSINTQVDILDEKISTIIKELNPPTLSIPGIGVSSCAVIISEFGDINRFGGPNQMLSFAGLEPGINQSGLSFSKGKMVKRGSSHLRYSLMNVAMSIVRHNPVFYDYYYKKRTEGKPHRVALSHICKKLIRVIYILETKNIQFDSSLLR